MLVTLLLVQTFAAPDSAAIRRDAGAAQAAFERTRRHQLPLTSSGFRCEVQVGRFCYWYDESEPPPPPEPERIAEARERLLTRLAAAAERLPGDGWIAGQRVKYLVEQGRLADAVEAARACAGDPWWCAALEGFALHAAAEFRAAERAFDRALDGMPGEERCRWTDLSPLLENPEARTYRKEACAAREVINRRLLAQRRPLLSVPGNELRTEILARHTYRRMQEDALTHHGWRMGADHGEMVLRYGWAKAWSRRMEWAGAASEWSVIGHEEKPAYPYLIPLPAEPGGVSWPPSGDQPRARFSSSRVRALVPLGRVQWARFARGDSILVVAAFAARRDTLFADNAVQAALTVVGTGGTAGNRTPAPEGQGALVVVAPSGGEVASMEVEDSRDGVWAVDRLAMAGGDPPPAISDLLVIGVDTTDPTRLDEAVDRALADLRLDEPRIGLYWETAWPRTASQPVTIRLEVVPGRPGFLGRVGRTLGLARGRPPISLTWDRVLPAGWEPVPHTIEVDLSRLKAGRYEVIVEVRDRAGVRWATARTVELVRP